MGEVGMEDPPTSSAAEENILEDGEGEKAKHKRNRPRRKRLYADIRKQMEFYFSDANITKNRMMKEMVQKSEYVDLKEFLGFNKIAMLTTSMEELKKSLKKSEKLVLSDDESGVKRKIPYDEKNLKNEQDIENCTIYIENVPRNVGHAWVEKVFEEFGSISYISLPKFRKSGLPKGFGFIEFDDKESADRCLEAYGSMGACLSSGIDPAELQSVRTFDEEAPAEVKSEIKAKDQDKPDQKSSRKRQIDEVDNSSGAIPTTPAKIKKTETDEFEREPLESSRKRDHAKIDSTTYEDSAVATKKKKKDAATPVSQESQDPSSQDEDVPNSSKDRDVVDSQSNKKKKRRRKKNKKVIGCNTEEKLITESIQLRILPKKHWRQLRNRYLNLQRENMSKLKKQLRSRPEKQQPAPPLKAPAPAMSKSICVKIKLNNPAESIDAFKSQVTKLAPKDWSNFLKFIDYEGELDAVVRFDGGPHAMIGIKIFFQNSYGLFKDMTVMSEEEMSKYWKTVKTNSKKDSKTPKIRGKDRLTNQALKAATHIRFGLEDLPMEKASSDSETEA